MIKADHFLVSFDMYTSNISKGETLHFCEPLLIAYRTEELGPYLKMPNEKLDPNHLHMKQIKDQVSKLLGNYPINIIDIIRTEL